MTGKPCHVVSLINMKGGVGKTTLAVGLAWELATQHRVLLVDIDPQFNATQWLVGEAAYLAWLNDPSKRTVFDVFCPSQGTKGVGGFGRGTAKGKQAAQLSNTVVHVKHGKTTLDVVPSTLELMSLDAAPRGTENRLTGFLKAARSAYDYVIIDCPPTASLFSYSAYLASDSYLVPVKPDPLSMLGLPLLERALEEYKQRSAHEVHRLGLVLTLVRGTDAMEMTSRQIKDQYKGEVFRDEMPQTTGVAEAVTTCLPLQLFAKTRYTLRDQLAGMAAEFTSRVGSL